MQHFLTMTGLDKHALQALLKTAASFISTEGNQLRIHNAPPCSDTRMGLLFFEPSTRTRLSFQMAAHYLNIPTFDFNADFSSLKKGESLKDTVRNLESLGMNVLVIRHPESGAAEAVASLVGPDTHVINAGDGSNQHPTQALLDMLTIQHFTKKAFSDLSVLIVGDILHSRVAHSDLAALKILGTRDIRVVAPPTLLPSDIEERGATVYPNLNAGLKDVDVIMGLRLQKERMQQAGLTSDAAFHAEFGLTAMHLQEAKKEAIIMHPGPVNRGIEMTDEVVDHPQSVILEQVKLGVAARMSVISHLIK